LGKAVDRAAVSISSQANLSSSVDGDGVGMGLEWMLGKQGKVSFPEEGGGAGLNFALLAVCSERWQS
jgi:hypothetical protein